MSPWVDVCADGRVGAGFRISLLYVLTARHCLPSSLSPPHGPVEVVERWGSREVRMPGRMCASADKNDLALIELEAESARPFAYPPSVDRVEGTPRWRCPYRRAPDLLVALSGRVTDAAFLHTCEAGGCVEALQLHTEEGLGSYAGYSGGPVEAETAAVTDGARWPVVGLLLEQVPDRENHLRAANVLIAVTMSHALRCFPQLDVAHLLGLLLATPDTSFPERPTASETVFDTADQLLLALRRRVESGLVDPLVALDVQRDILRRELDDQWGANRAG